MAELLNGGAQAPKETAVAKTDPNALVATSEEPLARSIAQVLAIAKDRYKMMVTLRAEGLKMTQPKHWTVQGPVPWLNSLGTDHMARLFGISGRVTNREKQVCKGEDGSDYYIWHVTVSVSLPGQPDAFEGVGAATSRDKFLGTLEEVEGRRSARTMADVEPNVIKKATTDAHRTAIHHLLGLRQLTWPDLESAGIKKSDVQAVNYRGKGKE